MTELEVCMSYFLGPMQLHNAYSSQTIKQKASSTEVNVRVKVNVSPIQILIVNSV